MKTTLLIILLSLATTLKAKDFNRQKMDSLFRLIDSHQKGMGSISVFEDGKEVYQYSLGYANVETKTRANEMTSYGIGSVSKTFTATLILQLVEEGKLSLETPLSEFFPQITQSENITLRHLLKHRSGIFNFTDSPDYPSWMEQPISRQQLLDKIQEHPNVFEPDQKAEYSNSNYVLLSMIAEIVEGKDFALILEERITQPYGLHHTFFDRNIDAASNQAQSYAWLGDWTMAPKTHSSVPLGAGAMASTPSDLNKFLHELFSARIVSRQTLDSMLGIEQGFGMGLFPAPFYEKICYGHTGGIDGFQSLAFYFPEEKVSVAYLSNGTVMAGNDILIGVLSILFDREYELPVFSEPMSLNPLELDQFLGIYSADGFPLKLTITRQDDKLFAQGTGQPAFPLQATQPNVFQFEPAGITITFHPQDETLLIRQAGKEFGLSKEK